MKRIAYQNLYKLLLILSNRFNHPYINQYKIAVGTTLLLLSSPSFSQNNPKKIEAKKDTVNASLVKPEEIEVLCYEVMVIPEDSLIYDIVDRMPEFPGGIDSLHDFMRKNLLYPQQHGVCVQGRVIVRIIVEKDGSISNPVILRSLGPNFDKEALRVIQLMPRWKPGTKDGETKRVKYIIPISFKYPTTTE